MHRSRRIPLIIFTCILTMGASVMFAAKPSKPGGGGGGSTGTPVTSTVFDQNAASESYRIRSDYALSGSQIYYHNVDSVVSQIQREGSYELSALSSPNRRLFLDLTHPVDPQKPAPAGALTSGSGHVQGRFIAMRSGSLATMTGVGSTLLQGLPFVFTGSDGKHYQLRMNSENEPGTTDAVFTCTAVDQNNACIAWSAAPVSIDGVAIGRLVKQETIKGKTVLTYYGDFYVTYSLSFTR